MIGIYVICFLIVPFSMLFQTKMTIGKKVLLEKNDTDEIKGIATCFIIFAHLIIPIKDELHGIGALLNVYTFTGGMGVLLFFFVSGYGIYKGYGRNGIMTNFWIKRFGNIYFPCVLIQFIFCLFRMVQERRIDISEMFFNSFFGAWFIDVIMIQYLIFYLAQKLSKNSKNEMIVVSFLLSMIVAIVFYMKGFNPRWYNGLLLFPIGMLVADKEQALLIMIHKKWIGCLTVSAVLFIAWGGVFAYGKGRYFGIDICKVLAGTCLCGFICTMYMRIQLCSKFMQYIGKRSLFFYLIHINLIEICEKTGISKVETFYSVIF